MRCHNYIHLNLDNLAYGLHKNFCITKCVDLLLTLRLYCVGSRGFSGICAWVLALDINFVPLDYLLVMTSEKEHSNSSRGSCNVNCNKNSFFCEIIFSACKFSLPICGETPSYHIQSRVIYITSIIETHTGTFSMQPCNYGNPRSLTVHLIYIVTKPDHLSWAKGCSVPWHFHGIHCILHTYSRIMIAL